jgi:hypothetical protein
MLDQWPACAWLIRMAVASTTAAARVAMPGSMTIAEPACSMRTVARSYSMTRIVSITAMRAPSSRALMNDASHNNIV